MVIVRITKHLSVNQLIKIKLHNINVSPWRCSNTSADTIS